MILMLFWPKEKNLTEWNKNKLHTKNCWNQNWCFFWRIYWRFNIYDSRIACCILIELISWFTDFSTYGRTSSSCQWNFSYIDNRHAETFRSCWTIKKLQFIVNGDQESIWKWCTRKTRQDRVQGVDHSVSFWENNICSFDPPPPPSPHG